MPAAIIIPDPDSLLASFTHLIKCYALDYKEDYPLYRRIKIIGHVPLFGGQRTAHLVWIVHLARFRRGGDCWRITQERPDLLKWAEGICAAAFDDSYVMDTFGLDHAAYDNLVAAEQMKYEK